MKQVLAIDEGTTGVTCLVLSADGVVTGRGYRELTQYFPQPGWVEHDASEIFERTINAARDAIAESGSVPDAIGITNQRETIVVWDRDTGELLLKAPRIAERVSGGAALAGTMDTWLIWKLTKGAVHATDPTNASRTLLFDIGERDWSETLCSLFGVPRSVLPEVRRSSGDFGAADAGFFGAAIPICGVAGDQQAALFGQDCIHAGGGKNTYGTGAFILLNTGDVRPE